jgi:hypothetical protein
VAHDVRNGIEAQRFATPGVVEIFSRLRLSGCGCENLRSRGMEDGARVVEGAKVRVGGQALEDPRADERDEEDGQRPLAAGLGRDRRQCREGSRGISRAEGPRARNWPLARHFSGGCGDPRRKAKERVVRHSRIPCGPGNHVVSRTIGLGRRGQDDPDRQEREKRSEPGTIQETTSQEFHSTPHVGQVNLSRRPVGRLQFEAKR